jgi:4-hydroxyphenylpyruvate dioxygenase-like putative hemolysin
MKAIYRYKSFFEIFQRQKRVAGFVNGKFTLIKFCEDEHLKKEGLLTTLVTLA